MASRSSTIVKTTGISSITTSLVSNLTRVVDEKHSSGSKANISRSITYDIRGVLQSSRVETRLHSEITHEKLLTASASPRVLSTAANSAGSFS